MTVVMLEATSQGNSIKSHFLIKRLVESFTGQKKNQEYSTQNKKINKSCSI